MGLLRWFTHNQAHTDGSTHPDLAPLVLPVPPQAAAERVRAAVATLPRWRVEGGTAQGLHLTRRTRVIRFVDDIRVTLAADAGGTVVHAESKSRLGTGDLGQNRRNILELFRELRNAEFGVRSPKHPS